MVNWGAELLGRKADLSADGVGYFLFLFVRVGRQTTSRVDFRR